ncbi:fasciclin domain-containing protein [Aequorivita sp. SDUM287046]|uniref:Fasciclin domain-containing protein n=1 Tax=Aequorivita aurantiaca TaxID=3053356 RepID=A0ABT8DIF4_9FLAO|nr:fasciclin domain-containing protein [Aequorivita aurantiaca]MDN3724584.1 fasciclin domain-containing protein [Aequorivita aurantiaca]
MPKTISFLILLFLILTTFSCKNDTLESAESKIETTAEPESKAPVKRAPKKDLTAEDIAIIKSVMSRIMTEPQLKKYASYLVTAEMGTMLSEEKGPFTIFAPTNLALGTLSGDRARFFASPENKPKLEEMLKSYIVPEKIDTEALLKTIAKNGRAKLKTIDGQTLIATKSGEEIIISNGMGTSVKVIKGGIEASNGVVYVVDGLLPTN